MGVGACACRSEAGVTSSVGWSTSVSQQRDEPSSDTPRALLGREPTVGMFQLYSTVKTRRPPQRTAQPLTTRRASGRDKQHGRLEKGDGIVIVNEASTYARSLTVDKRYSEICSSVRAADGISLSCPGLCRCCQGRSSSCSFPLARSPTGRCGWSSSPSSAPWSPSRSTGGRSATCVSTAG